MATMPRKDMKTPRGESGESYHGRVRSRVSALSSTGLGTKISIDESVDRLARSPALRRQSRPHHRRLHRSRTEATTGTCSSRRALGDTSVVGPADRHDRRLGPSLGRAATREHLPGVAQNDGRRAGDGRAVAGTRRVGSLATVVSSPTAQHNPGAGLRGTRWGACRSPTRATSTPGRSSRRSRSWSPAECRRTARDCTAPGRMEISLPAGRRERRHRRDRPGRW